MSSTSTLLLTRLSTAWSVTYLEVDCGWLAEFMILVLLEEMFKSNEQALALPRFQSHQVDVMRQRFLDRGVLETRTNA